MKVAHVSYQSLSASSSAAHQLEGPLFHFTKDHFRDLQSVNFSQLASEAVPNLLAYHVNPNHAPCLLSRRGYGVSPALHPPVLLRLHRLLRPYQYNYHAGSRF